MRILKVVKAEYDYDTEVQGELSFKEDQILLITDYNTDPQWWEAVTVDQSEIGRIPSNYVKECTGKISELLYDYEASAEEEVSVKQGQQVTVYDDRTDAEWTIIGNGQRFGFVPANYLQQEEMKPSGSAEIFSGKELELYQAIKETGAVSQYSDPLAQYAAVVVKSPGSEYSDFDEGFVPQVQPAIQVRPPTATQQASSLCAVTALIKVGKKQRSKAGYLTCHDGLLEYLDETDKSVIQSWNIVNDLKSYKRNHKKLIVEQNGGTNQHEFQANNKAQLQELVAQMDQVSGTASSNTPLASQESLNTKSKQLKRDGGTQSSFSISSPLAGSVVKLSSGGGSQNSDIGLVPSAEQHVRVVAIYGYKAQTADEISFAQGNQLLVTNQSDPEWWTGFSLSNQSQVGLIPSSYVKIVEDGNPKLLMPKEAMQQVQVAQPSRTQMAVPPIAQPSQPQMPMRPSTTDQSSQGLQAIEQPLKPPRPSSVASNTESVPRMPPRPSSSVSQQSVDMPRSRSSTSRPQSVAGAVPTKPPRQKTLSSNSTSIPPPKPPRSVKSASSEATSPRSQIQSAGVSPQQMSAPALAPRPTELNDDNNSINRVWTDTSKSFSVEAKYLGFKDGKVQLHKANGVKIAVPLSKLCKEDSDFVSKLTNGASDVQQSPLNSASAVKSPTEQQPVLLPRPNLENQQQSIQPALSRNVPMEQQQHVHQSGLDSATGVLPKTVQSYVYNGFDWYKYFLQQKIDDEDSKTYAMNFVAEKMGEDVSDHLNREILKDLGVREGDILRILATGPRKQNSWQSFGADNGPSVFPELPAPQSVTGNRRHSRRQPSAVESNAAVFTNEPTAALSSVQAKAEIFPASKPVSDLYTSENQEAQKKILELEQQAQQRNIAAIMAKKQQPAVSNTSEAERQAQLSQDEELAKSLHEKEMRRAGLLPQSPTTASQSNPKPVSIEKASNFLLNKKDEPAWSTSQSTSQPAVSSRSDSMSAQSTGTMRRGRTQQTATMDPGSLFQQVQPQQSHVQYVQPGSQMAVNDPFLAMASSRPTNIGPSQSTGVAYAPQGLKQQQSTNQPAPQQQSFVPVQNQQQVSSQKTGNYNYAGPLPPGYQQSGSSLIPAPTDIQPMNVSITNGSPTQSVMSNPFPNAVPFGQTQFGQQQPVQQVFQQQPQLQQQYYGQPLQLQQQPFVQPFGLNNFSSQQPQFPGMQNQQSFGNQFMQQQGQPQHNSQDKYSVFQDPLLKQQPSLFDMKPQDQQAQHQQPFQRQF